MTVTFLELGRGNSVSPPPVAAGSTGQGTVLPISMVRSPQADGNKCLWMAVLPAEEDAADEPAPVGGIGRLCRKARRFGMAGRGYASFLNLMGREKKD